MLLGLLLRVDWCGLVCVLRHVFYLAGALVLICFACGCYSPNRGGRHLVHLVNIVDGVRVSRNGCMY